MRKVNELGLKTIYTSDQDFALHARMLYGLAYVPPADVPTALELIRATMPAVGQPLVQYFDSTYVRRPPMFHPAMWNVAELFEHTLPTTSNHVEAWLIFRPFEFLPFQRCVLTFCLLSFCLLPCTRTSTYSNSECGILAGTDLPSGE